MLQVNLNKSLYWQGFFVAEDLNQMSSNYSIGTWLMNMFAGGKVLKQVASVKSGPVFQVELTVRPGGSKLT